MRWKCLARDAQQQAGQQDVGQLGNKLIVCKCEHEGKYIGFFLVPASVRLNYSRVVPAFFFLIKSTSHIT